jgi:hypothetical protein
MLNILLWVEACAAQCPGDHGAAVRFKEHIVTISILLVVALYIKMNARHRTEKDKVKSCDTKTNYQNDTHQGIKEHGVINSKAVIRFTGLEDLSNNKPND